MPIHIIEVVCQACGNEWTKKRYEELRPVDASDGYCPSCGEDGDVMDERELDYQQKIMDEVRSDLAIAKAYPALFDDGMYAGQMRDAGRGHLLRGGA